MEKFNFKRGTIIEIPRTQKVHNVFEFLSALGYQVCEYDFNSEVDKVIFVDSDYVFGSSLNLENHFEKVRKCGYDPTKLTTVEYSQLIENCLGLSKEDFSFDFRNVDKQTRVKVYDLLSLVMPVESPHRLGPAQFDLLKIITGNQWRDIKTWILPFAHFSFSVHKPALDSKELLLKLNLITFDQSLPMPEPPITQTSLFNTFISFKPGDDRFYVNACIERAKELGFSVGHLGKFNEKCETIYRLYFNSNGRLGYATTEKPLFEKPSHSEVGLVGLFTVDQLRKLHEDFERVSLRGVFDEHTEKRSIPETTEGREVSDGSIDPVFNGHSENVITDYIFNGDGIEEQLFMGFLMPRFDKFKQLHTIEKMSPDAIFEKYVDRALDSLVIDSEQEMQCLFYPVSEYKKYLEKCAKDNFEYSQRTMQFSVFLTQFEISMRNFIKQYLGFDKIDKKAGFAIVSTEFILGAKSFTQYMDNLQQLIILHNEIKKVYVP